MRRDPYEVLGVSRDAGEARRSRRRSARLARELHPDVNRHDPEAEEKFKEAAEAYEILSDAERRATYDRYGFEGLESRGFASQAHGFGSFADIFDAFFGGDPFGASAAAGGGGRVQGGDVGRGGGDHAGAGGERHARVEVAYDLVDACERCHGNGAEPGTPIETCPTCGGAGRVRAVTPHRVRPARARAGLRGLRRRRARCPPSRARRAAGRGRKAVRKTLEVDIPAGIADEQRIRLTGRGHAGERGGPPGDLYVLVRVAEDERFLRDGSDLVTRRGRARAGRGARHARSPCRRSTATRRSTSPPAPSRARW